VGGGEGDNVRCAVRVCPCVGVAGLVQVRVSRSQLAVAVSVTDAERELLLVTDRVGSGVAVAVSVTGEGVEQVRDMLTDQLADRRGWTLLVSVALAVWVCVGV